MTLNLSGSTGVSGVDGSAATPALQGNDTNTGISFDTDVIIASTAGTERVRIDSSGRLLVGTNSIGSNAASSVAAIKGSNVLLGTGQGQLAVITTNTQAADVGGSILLGGQSTQADWPYACIAGRSENNSYAGYFAVGTSNAAGAVFERVRIDSSGRLLVGTSAARANFFNQASGFETTAQIEGTTYQTSSLSLTQNVNDVSAPFFVLGKTRSGSVGGNTVVSSGDSLGTISFQGSDGSELVEGARIRVEVDGTPGANDMPGRIVLSTTADGASSTTERMRITQAGAVIIGKTTAADNTAGTYTLANGQTSHTVSGDYPLYINRLTNDGTLIRFDQDTVNEGSISVSGTTVSYNGAHLSRWSQLSGIDPHDKDQRPEILRGTVMSNLDEMCEWIDPETGEPQANEQLNKTKISDVEGDKDVAGIFQSWDDDDDTWVNDFYLAMTGDFIIRIAAGVTVERGDLLMSAGDGTAKPQDDDIIRSKTIAKVTCTNVTCTYDDGSYCVPCVLMAC